VLLKVSYIYNRIGILISRYENVYSKPVGSQSSKKQGYIPAYLDQERKYINLGKLQKYFNQMYYTPTRPPPITVEEQLTADL